MRYLDLYFALVMWGIALVTVAAYLVRALLRGRARFARTDADGGSVFLDKRAMEYAYWMLDPLVNGLIALRVTPNMVTAFSLLPALGAGVAIAYGWFGLACMLGTIATLSDIVDGVIARRTGVSSDAGEVFDAAVDRFGEFFLMGGLIFYYRDTWSVLLLALAATVGAFMISYSTAKAEAVHVPPPRGAMRRSERAVYLITAAGMTAITKVILADTPVLSLREAPMILSIAIVAGVANVSAVQRLGAIIQTLARAAAASAGGRRGGDRRYRHQARDAHPRRRLTACSRRTRRLRCGRRCPVRRARRSALARTPTPRPACRAMRSWPASSSTRRRAARSPTSTATPSSTSSAASTSTRSGTRTRRTSRRCRTRSQQVSVGSFTSRARVELGERLAAQPPAPGVHRLQLYSGGAEAVESALRLAKCHTGKYEMVSFWGGFHGKTLGALSLMGSTFKHGLGPMATGSHLLPYADCYRCPGGSQLPQLRHRLRRRRTRRR